MEVQRAQLQGPQTGRKEFIALMAAVMSLVALSIDALLPALGEMGANFNLENTQDTQLILSAIFLGMSFGLMIYGPLSDAYGRKFSIFLGVGVFLVGSLIAIFSKSYEVLLIGRFLQGFGASSCRVSAMAMISDRFEGQEMAKIMSLIMMVFIMVPALAPSVGQTILVFSDWRGIFVFIFFFALVTVVWLQFRQGETLAPENRLEFSTKVIGGALFETITHPVSFAYTLGAGIVFGAFIGYLSTAQPLLQDVYQLGDNFAMAFGLLALAIGVSSLLNSKLLAYLSMQILCMGALGLIALASFGFYFYASSLGGLPLLNVFMVYLAFIFLNTGILFGNLNTLALQPLSHIAGTASSVIASLQTLVSVGVGGVIGYSFDGGVLPLVLGFCICSTLAFMINVLVFFLSKKSEPSRLKTD